MNSLSKKTLRAVDLAATLINVAGLALGLLLIESNPRLAFWIVAASILIYGFLRFGVGLLDLQRDEEPEEGIPAAHTASESGSRGPLEHLDLRDYRAEIVFRRRRADEE